MGRCDEDDWSAIVGPTTTQPGLVHYVPVATTALSAVFCVVLLGRYRFKGKGAHLLWWAGGVFCYGLGTALEASVTLFGNSIALTKAWYIAGALLGGYPLAQGTVYLLLKRRTADVLSALTVPFIIIFSVFVVLSPANTDELLPHKPAGAVIGWTWIRYFTPVINLYAVFFLIGGALLSAYRFAKKTSTIHRAVGNAFIAAGALLPGIGGGMAKAGMIEALYIGEFTGIILIWIGYNYCVSKPKDAIAAEIAQIERATLEPPVTARPAPMERS